VDQRRLLLFFLASLIILVGWQLLVPAPPPESRGRVAPATPAATPVAAPATAAAAAPTATPPVAATEALAAPSAAPVAATAERRVQLRTDDFVAVFSNRGAQLVSFRLNGHEDAKGQPLELVRRRSKGPWPLGLVGPDLAALPLGEALFAVAEGSDAEGRGEVRFTYRGPLGSASKVVRVLGPGLLGLEVQCATPGWGLVLGPGLRNPTGDELEDRALPRSAVYRAAGELEVVGAGGAEELLAVPGEGLAWAGVEDNYFLSVVIPETPVEEVVLQPAAVAADERTGRYEMTPFRDEEALAGAAQDLPRDLLVVLRPRGDRLSGAAYLGAKEYETLAQLPWGLEGTLQWGMFGFLARPLLWLLLWIHQHVPNYGWAIAILTLIIRVVLFPLTWQSQKSMGKMQELQPRMQAIRQKHRGKLRDKKGRMDLEAQRKMNEEIQELFRSEGANPYGGCLPILVQIPVFFALFSMLRSAVELRQAPWVLWIHDLSSPDPFFILPVLMGATQIYQMRMTPMSGDPMQRRMMQLFPWIFTIFSLSFPAGLVLYWTVNNLVTIGQTWGFLEHKKRVAARAEPKKGRKGGQGKPDRAEAKAEKGGDAA
jgi:YidC/Oxa1 family membrane protein insertase